MATRKLERRPSVLDDTNVDTLYHHFLRLDKDGNGMIDRAEFMTLPAIQANPLAPRILDIFDTDRGGSLDFGEFTAGLAIFSARTSNEKKLRFAFDIYDLDRDGYISNGELCIVLKMMTGDKMSDEQLQQVVDKSIRDADKDHDGRISFDEFKVAVERKNTDFLNSWSIRGL